MNCTECGNMAYHGNKHATWCPHYRITTAVESFGGTERLNDFLFEENISLKATNMTLVRTCEELLDKLQQKGKVTEIKNDKSQTFRGWIRAIGEEEIPIDDVINYLLARQPHPKRWEVMWELIESRCRGTKWVPQGVYDDEYYEF